MPFLPQRAPLGLGYQLGVMSLIYHFPSHHTQAYTCACQWENISLIMLIWLNRSMGGHTQIQSLHDKMSHVSKNLTICLGITLFPHLLGKSFSPPAILPRVLQKFRETRLIQMLSSTGYTGIILEGFVTPKWNSFVSYYLYQSSGWILWRPCLSSLWLFSSHSQETTGCVVKEASTLLP